MVLTDLELEERREGTIQEALEKMVRERTGGTGPAKLTNPINIGVGTK